MHSANQMHRRCVDCYYRVGHACKLLDISLRLHGTDTGENCEFFIRASLRFAFFPKF